MASTNFDALNVQLSRMIEDPVAAATTDGDQYTSGYRDNLLNKACRDLQKRWAAEGNDDALRQYLNTEAQSLSSSTKALSSWTGDVLTIRSVYNSTDEVIPYPVANGLKEEAQTGNNRYLSVTANTSLGQKYYVNANAFFLLGGTATSSIRLTYVKKHATLAANDAGGAGDITIPNQYWEDVLREAFKIFAKENPSAENTVRLQLNA